MPICYQMDLEFHRDFKSDESSLYPFAFTLLAYVHSFAYNACITSQQQEEDAVDLLLVIVQV